jgi:hypothetical protein
MYFSFHPKEKKKKSKLIHKRKRFWHQDQNSVRQKGTWTCFRRYKYLLSFSSVQDSLYCWCTWLFPPRNRYILRQELHQPHFRFKLLRKPVFGHLYIVRFQNPMLQPTKLVSGLICWGIPAPHARTGGVLIFAHRMLKHTDTIFYVVRQNRLHPRESSYY